MTLRLNVNFKPASSGNQAELAALAWAVFQEQGLVETMTHFTLGHSSRGRKRETMGAPFTRDNERVSVFDGPKRGASTRVIELGFRYDLSLRVSWREAAPEILFDQCVALLAALDEALSPHGWFFFSSLGGLLDDSAPRAFADPPRWHRWLKGDVFVDILDTRLAGVVDTLREVTLPPGVTWTQEGHLVFVRWCDTIEDAALSRAMGVREQFLADTFFWQFDSDDGPKTSARSHNALPFPDATNSRQMEPSGKLPKVVEALATAASRGHHRKVAKLLAGLSRAESREALGPICRVGDLATAESLLDAGATVDHVGKQGWPPLLQAVSGRQVEVVQMLLERGATIDATSKVDRVTALHVAASANVKEWAMMNKATSDTSAIAEFKDQARRIAAILIEAGAPLDAQSRNGQTAFHLAVSDRLFDVAGLLLRAGADPTLRDAEAASALELMAVRGHVEELIEFDGIVAARTPPPASET